MVDRTPEQINSRIDGWKKTSKLKIAFFLFGKKFWEMGVYVINNHIHKKKRTIYTTTANLS